MKVTLFYVGASLLAPLRKAESEINRRHDIGLTLRAYNCGAPLAGDELRAAQADVAVSDLLFIAHVTDEENATWIAQALAGRAARPLAVIVFNCMPKLMRLTRMGRLDFSKLMKAEADGAGGGEARARSLARKVASWMSDSIRRRKAATQEDSSKNGGPGHSQYVKLISRLPAILKFIPGAGRVGDIKNYLNLFCYFLQPTPNNIRSMLLLAIKQYVPGYERRFKIDPPESLPAVAIYHPDAAALFEDFEGYKRWYEKTRGRPLVKDNSVGLLLMRTQIVSDARRHYDGLIRAIEQEGLAVVPALSTFMDNRDACRQFFVGSEARVGQIISLTGFSFVGGPAMNDSEAAARFLSELDVPYRSMVSLDIQTVENWESSRLGLNPVQTAMQVAIPEIDGAGEPMVFGGMPRAGDQPEPLEERCQRIARRLARWNRLRVSPRGELKLAMLVYCFPPNKGNIGTAADLDVFPSLMEVLARLKSEGYLVEMPETADHLRGRMLEGNAADFGTLANVAYRMGVDEYRRLCPFVKEIEKEWGRAPGRINSNGRELLMQGIELGNVFIGIQPTFGYEGDPMRLLSAESGAPHHAFMGLYTYVEKVFRADAVVHVGTHGAMEFMPGKQVGMSASCWPDRLIGDLPNVYIYSVNNPSEGTIAKRRSYAELVSYLTPPIENAGLYKELATMKELLLAYRKATGETERQRLYEAIEDHTSALNL